ncbi:oligogalacturonate lyase family protein [Candidatus Halobonum tyrrellensis]|uniref:Oligogalacturonate lyase domain-containing protein n=1 Tax=Candidatus Halobonum tyrrellensis G22 TaxID=1324957 RepID=V4H8H1_9EURY|nr:oligogalacturonate lyase family protein [Candidatus Halobonum tyrrellensis]ESP87005.1 hypothetical protein K933_15837 [Candidatus Halobonum tyrrellensis G22]
MPPETQQGPDAGRERPSESERYDDPETGARVTRLTAGPGEDSHLYFTEPGWYDGGRRLLFLSDRGDGTLDLHSADLRTGTLTQVTDLPGRVSGVTRCASEPVAYVWHDDRLCSVDLETLTVTALYDLPDGYGGSHLAATADGDRVVTALSATDAELGVDRGDGDREDWIERRMAAGPHSQVVSVPTDGGDPTVHVDDDRWLNHVNASPTRPDLVTYCEEGPWEQVDRVWALDLSTDETWRVRPTGPDEAVGHEYWLADGETVGYHGWRGTRDDPDAFFGQVRYDDTDRREAPAPDIYTHFHSNTRELVVGDGTYVDRGVPYLLLWAWDESENAYDTPRKLAGHGWAGDDDAHPHSRLSPDGSTVVFDSARGGDGSDVYLVDVPADLDALPRADELD